jgi:1,2-diacylglycerol 3-beta-galactosyltransferase
VESHAPRVLLLYSATGNGHRSVAHAIRSSIEEISDIDCREIEVFAAVRPPFIGAWPKVYSWMATKCVWLYDLLFFITDTHVISVWMASIIYKLSKHRISQIVSDIDPNVIVATAPFVSEVAVRARSELGADFRIVNVVSDLVTPHASWACWKADVTIACTSCARKRLMKAGIPADKVIEMQLPVQRQFYDRLLGKEDCRRKLGIQSGPFTITLSGGSLGAGPILSSAKALVEAFPEAQLLIVAGRNKHLYKVLRSQFEASRIRVYGFTDQMPLLVRGSDVFVSKGGPSSIMEAFAAGRPIVIIGEVGMQERGNGELARRLGIGYYAWFVNELISIIESLVGDIEVKQEKEAPVNNGSQGIARLVLDYITR